LGGWESGGWGWGLRMPLPGLPTAVPFPCERSGRAPFLPSRVAQQAASRLPAPPTHPPPAPLSGHNERHQQRRRGAPAGGGPRGVGGRRDQSLASGGAAGRPAARAVHPPGYEAPLLLGYPAPSNINPLNSARAYKMASNPALSPTPPVSLSCAAPWASSSRWRCTSTGCPLATAPTAWRGTRGEDLCLQEGVGGLGGVSSALGVGHSGAGVCQQGRPGRLTGGAIAGPPPPPAPTPPAPPSRPPPPPVPCVRGRPSPTRRATPCATSTWRWGLGLGVGRCWGWGAFEGGDAMCSAPPASPCPACSGVNPRCVAVAVLTPALPPARPNRFWRPLPPSPGTSRCRRGSRSGGRWC
jgi:hypothetical protein